MGAFVCCLYRYFWFADCCVEGGGGCIHVNSFVFYFMHVLVCVMTISWYNEGR